MSQHNTDSPPRANFIVKKATTTEYFFSSKYRYSKYCTVRGVKIWPALDLAKIALSQKAIHICARSTTVVALRGALQILSVPQPQLAVSEDAVRFLGDAEHKDGRRGGVAFQIVPSRSHIDFRGSGSQYFLLLVCYDS